MTNIKTPLEMLAQWEASFPDEVYLRQSTGEGWLEFTWGEVADRVRRIATFIDQQDLPCGSNIVLWSANSADWVMVDLAIMLAGHVTVPIYPAQDAETARYILGHSEAKMVFAGSFENAENLDELLPGQVPTVSIHGASIECQFDVAELVQIASSEAEFAPRSLDDVATIIYSSGTSGTPKGVMHTFRTISETAALVGEAYHRIAHHKPSDARERLLSYLPFAHAAERCLVEMTSLYLNSCVSISAGLEHFAKETREVGPTFFGAVPRIWFKLREGVEAAFRAQGKSIETDEDRLMVRQMLGLDATLSSITGSAPVSPEVHAWYTDIGLPLRESYSLTETFSHGTFWDRDEPCKPGCVGRAAKGVRVKIDDEGQIHFSGKTVMKGYYKNPELTDQVLQDGWFATGDLGRIDEDGNLWLTGRVGSVFKSSKGKFIHPERLEREFYKDPWVEQVCVFGRGLGQPAAVICLPETLHEKTDTELSVHFEGLREQINATLPAYEKLGGVLLVRDLWHPDGGELTPTLKIKRRVIEDRYRQHLGDDVAGVVIADREFT